MLPSLRLQDNDAVQTEPLFQTDWWFDAATGGRWDLATVQRDGEVVASLPFQILRRGGLRFIALPRYTRTVSPRLLVPPGKPVTRLGRSITLLGELMSSLPPHDRLELTLTPGSQLEFPYVALGYLVSHNFTFVTQPNRSEEEAWAGMEQKTRNVVASAAKRLSVEQHSDLDRFIALARAERGRAQSEHDFPAIKRIFEACSARAQSVILSVRDEQGDAGACVLVWDNERVYHWLSARAPARAGTGGGSLLVWEGIKFALQRGLTYDADGFATTQSALFLMRFGLEPLARPVVSRGSRAWRFAFLVRTALSPNRDDLFYRA